MGLRQKDNEDLITFKNWDLASTFGVTCLVGKIVDKGPIYLRFIKQIFINVLITKIFFLG